MASRQVEYQHRQNAKGLCKLCPKPLMQSGLCQAHYIRHLEFNRDYKRQSRGKIK